LLLGLVMMAGGVVTCFFGMMAGVGATLSSHSHTGSYLMMLAGLVLVVIGLVVTVASFRRASRKQRTGEALKGGLEAATAAPGAGSVEALGQASSRCPECGSENPPDCIFCLKCGAVLPAPESGPAAAPPPQPERKVKGKRRWIWVAVVGLLAVLIAVVVIVLTRPMTAERLVRQYQGGKRDFLGIQLPYASLALEHLSEVDLTRADLRWANLNGTVLIAAKLTAANLSGANLTFANLSKADLRGANLSGSNLWGAEVTDEQLSQAASLQGATMPDGSVHP